MHHRPPLGMRCCSALLYVHPFGHELYHSRPVMAFLFRSLAQCGVSTLSLDLYGCGDSEGEFFNARWNHWLAGVKAGVRYLQQQSSVPVSIGGLRLGAALCVDAALDLADQPGCHLDKILLFEPVLSGEEMMTQFLRLRVAFSGLRNIPEKRETTLDLRSRLAAGEPLDVAGYLLSPELVEAIDNVSLAKCRPPANMRIEWLQNQTASANAVEVAESWRALGATVTTHSLQVKPWWVHTRGVAGDYEELALTLKRIFAPPTP